MERIIEIVTSITQIQPYASLALSVISTANKIVRLAKMMSNVFMLVNDAEALETIEAHIKTITLLIQQVTECGYFIAEFAEQKNFWIRSEKYSLSDLDKRITDYEDKLRELKTAFLAGVAVQSEITVPRMINLGKDNEASIELNDLACAFGARFHPGRGCLPGTRQSLLRNICDILNNPDKDASRVCLLTGVAGSGKSAVAHSIAHLYNGQKRLGSSYFFARDDIASRNPKTLFSTIARDLSDFDPQYRSALRKIVKNDRALRTSPWPMEQLERFIIEPSKELDPIGPIVIVIDALDESGDRARRQELLRIISQKIAQNALPTNLRFLITALAEEDIIISLPPGPPSRIVRIVMDDVPRELVDRDIERFIRHALQQHFDFESSPDKERCRRLVQYSQQLFQWASAACHFINGHNGVGLHPYEQFDKILHAADTGGSQLLDSLYQTALSQLFTREDTRKRFRTVMVTVLALDEPLSLASLCALSDADLTVRAIINALGSLLTGMLNEEPICVLHSSFRDFLLDEARSTVFYGHTSKSSRYFEQTLPHLLASISQCFKSTCM
ncbi:hypothetical protein OG21DRAFT_521580 [Imleria badia]|nr:hypothetical protein OG21DRAFT_521580 [Imleria badia]